MKRTSVALAATLAMISLAQAQTYKDTGGTIVPAVAAIPFPYQPLCPSSHGVSLATATTLAAASMLPTGVASGRSCVNQTVETRYCVVTAHTAAVNYTLDGSTTASASTESLSAGTSMSLIGAAQIADADFYSASGGTIDVECSQ